MGYSPAQLLNNRMLKFKIPVSVVSLQTKVLCVNEVYRKKEIMDGAATKYYNHTTRALPILNSDDAILLKYNLN